MTKSHHPSRPFVATLAAFAALVGASAIAGEHDQHKKKDHEAARQALLRKSVLPLSRILSIAAERAPGEVIEVELEEASPGKLKYDLKILAKNGRVRELELDAKTGATLKLEDD
jgi:uncharacterized membrane protein YkoI